MLKNEARPLLALMNLESYAPCGKRPTPSGGFELVMGDLFRKPDSNLPFSVLREFEEWGLRSADLVAPPRRLWSGKDQSQNVVEEGTDIRRLQQGPDA